MSTISEVKRIKEETLWLLMEFRKLVEEMREIEADVKFMDVFFENEEEN